MSDLLNATTKKPACGCDTRFASQVSKYDHLSEKYFGQHYRCLTIDQKITITDIWDERNQ